MRLSFSIIKIDATLWMKKFHLAKISYNTIKTYKKTELMDNGAEFGYANFDTLYMLMLLYFVRTSMLKISGTWYEFETVRSF